MPTVSETINHAAELLRKNGIADSRREAKSLLMLTLQKDEAFLIAYDNYELTTTEKDLFDKVLQRRANREPLQYIRGHQEFYGLDFVVTSDVLIPRPETELIVEHALEYLKNLKRPRFCEVGTGSGCISVSILHHAKTASAIGLDISEKALEITRRNSLLYDVANRLQLIKSDVFENLPAENFDLIVSNPPYISSEEMKNLQPEVKNFEPLNALTDNADGLSIIHKIIKGTSNVLKPNGLLLMEIGFDQSEKILPIFDKKNWQNIEFIKDLQGIFRVVKARKSCLANL